MLHHHHQEVVVLRLLPTLLHAWNKIKQATQFRSNIKSETVSYLKEGICPMKEQWGGVGCGGWGMNQSLTELVQPCRFELQEEQEQVTQQSGD